MQLNTQYSTLPQLNTETSKKDKTLEKIASALQLGMEDSSSRAIADMLQNDISGMGQGVANANDAISMMQIAGGVLNSLSDQTQTLNELSVRYNNAAFSSDQQQQLQQEFSRTVDAMNQSMQSASFNGKPLFGTDLNFSLGSTTVSASLPSIPTEKLSITDQNSVADFQKSLTSAYSDVGSTTNTLVSQTDSLLTNITSTAAARSRLADTEMANAVNEFQKSNQKIDATLIAQTHQNDVLRQSITRLLG